ncbi:MAG: hypothetical protein ACRDFR_09010 [Candidatus Limnocylindria bacterium]
MLVIVRVRLVLGMAIIVFILLRKAKPHDPLIGQLDQTARALERQE